MKTFFRIMLSGLFQMVTDALIAGAGAVCLTLLVFWLCPVEHSFYAIWLIFGVYLTVDFCRNSRSILTQRVRERDVAELFCAVCFGCFIALFVRWDWWKEWLENSQTAEFEYPLQPVLVIAVAASYFIYSTVYRAHQPQNQLLEN